MKKYHHCVKFTYPLSFQTRIPKVDQHTGGKWLKYKFNSYRHEMAACCPTSVWFIYPKYFDRQVNMISGR